MVKSRTQLQYRKLINLISETPDIAQGLNKREKSEINAFWDNVANELNVLGPPIKDSNGWRKTWSDWKCYIKKKMVFNKREKANGGGNLKVITDLEMEVIVLTGLSTYIEELRGAQAFEFLPIPTSENSKSLFDCEDEPEGDLDEPEGDLDETEKDLDDPMKSSPEPPAQSSEIRETVMVQEHVELQKEMLRKMSIISEELTKLTSGIKRTCRGIDSLHDIEKKKLKEQQRHNEVLENLLQKTVEIKQQNYINVSNIS